MICHDTWDNEVYEYNEVYELNEGENGELGRKDWLAYDIRTGGNVEIIDIEVSSQRRQGIGTKLIEFLIAYLKSQIPQALQVIAVARESNMIAREFYEGTKFTLLASVPGYYKDTNESGYIYGRSI